MPEPARAGPSTAVEQTKDRTAPPPPTRGSQGALQELGAADGAGIGRSGRVRAAVMAAGVASAKQMSAAYVELQRREKAGVGCSAELDRLADEMDASKRGLLELLRSAPTLVTARDVARQVAILHKKPAHAREVNEAVRRATAPDRHASWSNLGYGNASGLAQLRRDLQLAAELVTLGELESPTRVINHDGRLSDADRRDHISPINGRAAELVGRAGLPDVAAAIRGDLSNKLAAIFHVIRDYSAMSNPRAWRARDYPPDGVLPPDEIRRSVLENAEKKHLDPKLVGAVLDIVV